MNFPAGKGTSSPSCNRWRSKRAACRRCYSPHQSPQGSPAESAYLDEIHPDLLYWLEVLIGLKVIELPATMNTAFKAKLICISIHIYIMSHEYVCVSVCVCVFICVCALNAFLGGQACSRPKPSLFSTTVVGTNSAPICEGVFWSPKLLPH